MTVDFPMKEKEQVWVGDLSTADKELLIKNLTDRYGEVKNKNKIPVSEITSINYSLNDKYLYVYNESSYSFKEYTARGYPTLRVITTPTRTIDLDSIL